MITDYSSTHSPITDTAIHTSQLQKFSSSQIGHKFLNVCNWERFILNKKAQHSSNCGCTAAFYVNGNHLVAFISDLHSPG